MFYKVDQEGYRELLDGVRMKTLVHGEKTLMCEFILKGGKGLPRHVHPYEQTGYLVSGRLVLMIGDVTYDVGPGDSWCIPPDVPHSAETIVDSIAIEVFSPLREDYLPKG